MVEKLSESYNIQTELREYDLSVYISATGSRPSLAQRRGQERVEAIDIFNQKPSNISPSDGATGVALQPELESSDYYSGGTDTYVEAEYNVIKSSDSTVVYNQVV